MLLHKAAACFYVVWKIGESRQYAALTVRSLAVFPREHR